LPLPAHPVFRKLYRLSVSQNIYRQIVVPLIRNLYGDDPTYKDTKSVESELTELHKCLWHLDGPQPYPGAVAGRLEELLYPYRQSLKNDGRSIEIGAVGAAGTTKAGGDVTVVKTDGRTITAQLKVSNAATERGLEEHITKAGAQLTGQTGERPETGAEGRIILVVQNTEAFESYTVDKWFAMVRKALNEDYTSSRPGRADHRIVTAKDIKMATHSVKILTRRSRFRFVVADGEVVIPSNAVKGIDAETAKTMPFTANKLHTHWDWLSRTWFPATFPFPLIPANRAVVNSTKNSGVGGAGAHPDLPNQ